MTNVTALPKSVILACSSRWKLDANRIFCSFCWTLRVQDITGNGDHNQLNGDHDAIHHCKSTLLSQVSWMVCVHATLGIPWQTWECLAPRIAPFWRVITSNTTPSFPQARFFPIRRDDYHMSSLAEQLLFPLYLRRYFSRSLRSTHSFKRDRNVSLHISKYYARSLRS